MEDAEEWEALHSRSFAGKRRQDVQEQADTHYTYS